MNDPTPDDLYNMACGSAMISTLDERGSTEERENLEARAVKYLHRAIEADQAGIMPMIPRDHDLDPLRDRTDFRDLVADPGFPRDPFTQPSPLALVHLPARVQQELLTLSATIDRQPADFGSLRARGSSHARRGAWADALPDYRKVLELHPPGTWATESDTFLAMEAAVVLLQAGDLNGYRRLAREMLDRFAAPGDPGTAERTAKVGLLLQPPEADRKRAAELAERSVRLGTGNPQLPWFQLVRGISAYRSDEFEEAVAWLQKAAKPELGPEFTSARQAYLAMALFRLGEPARARALLLEASGAIAVRMDLEDRGARWHDLGIAELARREAEALINRAPSQTTEPAGP